LQVSVALSDCIENAVELLALHYGIPYEILNLFASLRVCVYGVERGVRLYTLVQEAWGKLTLLS